MLFVLTGGVQTGKTRWLEELLADLQRAGVEPCGVMAPGVWADRRDDPESFPHADANGFEKLGIDNVLLPGGERIAFARRVDLAASEGSYDPSSQSGKAKLGWHISDEAINRVNGHLASLRSTGAAGELACGSAGASGDLACGSAGASGDLACGSAGAPSARFLVVDELGRLELERGEGLTEAIGILEDGPAPDMPHALIVVREMLLPHLEGRFGRWGETAHVNPDARSRELVLSSLGIRP